MKKIYALILFCATAFFAKAQWTNNTSLNTLVANKNASDIQIAGTDDGRIWIAFYSQNGSNYDMRAQLLDVNGMRMFGDTGVLVSNKKSGSATFVFNVCVDNDNNFIIGYQVEKGSGYECLLQKVSTGGQLLWTKNGVDLGAGLSPYPATLTTNEIAVAWNDNSGKIAYQKISASGVAAWNSQKTFSGNSNHIVSRAQVVAGKKGTFNMVYQEQFSSPFYTNLFEQKFNNNGKALWQNAVQLSTLTTVSYRYYDVHIEDDTTYVGYYGNPSGSNRFDAYVQRVNADGNLPYGENGSAFAPGFSGNNDPNEQTIFITKQKGINDVWAVSTITNLFQTASGIYVQKYDAATGNNYFGATAKEVFPISTKLISLAFSQLSLCDNDPVFLATSNNNKLAAVKLNNDGAFAWKNNIKIIGATSFTKFRYGFTDFYKRQAVAVWQENKGNGDLPYAQNIKCSGNTGPASEDTQDDFNTTEKQITIKSAYPNPVQNILTLTVASLQQSNDQVFVTDISGNVLKKFQQTINKGNNVIQLNVSDLKPGSYFIKISNKNAALLFNKQ